MYIASALFISTHGSSKLIKNIKAAFERTIYNFYLLPLFKLCVFNFLFFKKKQILKH